MLVVLERGSARAEAEAVAGAARSRGYHADVIGREGAFAVAITGGAERPPRAAFLGLPGVRLVEESGHPYFLASRAFEPQDSIVDVAGVEVGTRRVVLMAGPCAVESEDQLFAVAERVKKAGAEVLRGGAWKLRTSPWSFQGLEQRGLELLAEVKRSTGLRIATEVVSETTLPRVAEVADLVQIGARNMKNYELLKHVARCGRPVLLKRGMDATVGELLGSAEYLLAGGAPGVILCERGIRTFADHTRSTLDVGAIPVLKRLSHLPVLADPSHAAGQRELVAPLARAALAAGADGLLVEVHVRPGEALSDGPQALLPEDFDRLVAELRGIALAVGRTL